MKGITTMKKLFINLLCAFIPSKQLRHNLRKKYLPNIEKVIINQFVSDIQKLDLVKSYKNLIHNLDDESIKTVNKILARVFITQKQNLGYDIFEYKEREIIKQLSLTFYCNIIQLSNNCFAYNKYLLPINHFEPCVFIDKHEINSVNTNYFHNKDIIDAGGFIGDSAIVLSDYTTKNVHTFEPEKNNYNCLLQTIKLNDKTNIIANNVALGDENKKAQINTTGSAASITTTKPTNNSETVELITLDSYVKKHNLNVGLIKTDLEGFEQPFLKGAEHTIKTQKPTLLISIYHNASDFFKIKPMIESWNLGYKFRIAKGIDGQVLLETLLIAEVEEK